jgi:hypothetical protein
VLHLPDVAELVRQEILGGPAVSEDDRPPECVTVVPT